MILLYINDNHYELLYFNEQLEDDLELIDSDIKSKKIIQKKQY